MKFLFKFVYIVFTSGPVKTRHESSAYKNRSHSTELDISFTYNRKISRPRIDPCGTPQERSPGEESSFSILTKNVLFVNLQESYLSAYHYQYQLKLCRSIVKGMYQLGVLYEIQIDICKEYCFDLSNPEFVYV